MKKLFTILVLVTALASVAMAQDRPANRVGLYFDPVTRERCGDAIPGVAVDAYLIMDHISHTQRVLGWEMNISVVPGLVLTGFEYAGPGGDQIVDVPLGDVAVSYPSQYMPPFGTDDLLLVTYHFIAPATDEMVEFFIGPHTTPVHEPSPGFLTLVSGQETWVPLVVSSDSPGMPVAVLNGPDCDTVADEANTWGAVKSLYR